MTRRRRRRIWRKMRRLRLSESEQSKLSSSVSWSASRENERSRLSNSSWSAGYEHQLKEFVMCLELTDLRLDMLSYATIFSITFWSEAMWSNLQTLQSNYSKD